MAFPSDVSPDGVAFLKRVEGLRLKAYRDQGGVWTIGYGSTGPHVHEGMEITEERAAELLEDDLDVRCNQVKRALMREPSQEQFDAMVSLAYNVGVEAFRTSTVCKRFNEGDELAAANAFGLWVKSSINGKKVDNPGLIKRRGLEKAMFLEGTRVEPEATTAKPHAETLARSGTVRGGAVGGAIGVLSAAAAAINEWQQTMMNLPYVGDVSRLVVSQYPRVAVALAIGMVGSAGYVLWRRWSNRQDGRL